MKKLRQFMKFDAEGFFKDKDVRVMADEPWYEYNDGQIIKTLGTKYKCVIAVDNTSYDGDDVAHDLNGGEQVVVKVANARKEYKKFSKIIFVDVTASVYGQFQSDLSLKASDIIIELIK